MFHGSDMAVGAVVHGNAPIASLAFHAEGEVLAAGSSKSSLYIIDAMDGQCKKELRCQRHGIGKIAYTHHKDYILTTSSTVEGDNYLRYWCVYDNQYLRMYKAHNDQVTSLSMSPSDDNFLSTSADGALCLWNLSSPSCLAAMQLTTSDYERPIATYDPSGLVFGVMSMKKRKEGVIKLYDCRSYASGPFSTFRCSFEAIQQHLQASGMDEARARTLAQSTWTDLKFSIDGNHILVNTNSELLIVMDAYEGTIQHVNTERTNSSFASLEAGFAPDSSSVISACGSNDLLIWDFAAGRTTRLTGHVTTPTCVAANPKYDMMASACSNVLLWIPSQG